MGDHETSVLRFIMHAPTLESTWRSIILFGKNTSSYKFALGAALLELGRDQCTQVSLADLARPYSRHLLEHLAHVAKQSTSRTSKFLDACRRYRQVEIGENDLMEATVRRGFRHVLEAFHYVGHGTPSQRFFDVDGTGANRRLVLTDALHELASGRQAPNLEVEVESRWRLVETAWSLDMSRHIVSFDENTNELFVRTGRRVNVTSCRGALDGYQKGHCFYCFGPISVVPGAEELGDVDHVLPHVLHARGVRNDLNGIWNLVLACADCNRGAGGKFDRVPSLRYLERLHTRNEFLIGSHHPLRETLTSQTGASEPDRRRYLQGAYNDASSVLLGTWETVEKCVAMF